MLLRTIYYILSFFGLLPFILKGCNVPVAPLEPAISIIPFTLGDSTISISIRSYSTDTTLFFIQVHHNEITAQKATDKCLQKNGGIFLSVENNESRLIQFPLHLKKYTFDPNRIFTPVGLKTNLQLFNSYSPLAVQQVAQFSSQLLSLIPQQGIVVAVHNNTNDGYSINSYIEKEKYASDAAQVHIEPNSDPDDFFITTDASLFKSLCRLQFNAVLINNATASDDGSLSKYFGIMNRPYVNIEAEHNHLEIQTIMIQSLINIIKKN